MANAISSECTLWACVVPVGAMYTCHLVLTMVAFTCSFVLINNSCETAVRGTVNGIAMTIASITKALGPLCGSVILAWSLSSGRFKGFSFLLGHHFSFFLVSVLWCVAALVQWRRLPDILNKGKELSSSKADEEEQEALVPA